MTRNSLTSGVRPSTFHTRLQATKGWRSLKLHELWDYRELLFFLIWRDVSVRYKQTILGASWAVIQPFFTMIVFSIFFGSLAKMPSDGVPYPLFSYAALVPWTFFANGLQGAGNGLVDNANLLTKVYFPRLIIPIAEVAGGFVDFALAFIILLIIMVYYQVMPTGNVIFLPFFLLLAFGTALGVGLWLSALNVRFRDVRYIIPFIVQFWLFATPIAYPSSLIKDPLLHALYGINPMVGVIDGFRWALLGLDTSPGAIIWVSTAVMVLLLISGMYFFRRVEYTFADLV